jgi:tripartite-type tricarboxylate transporter receptor subunit TctC
MTLPASHTARRRITGLAASLTLSLTAALSTTLVTSSSAQAQAWPAHPLKLIVQYPAGGALDGLARQVSERASAVLGQPILVDNRPGASGFIAFEACAKAAPDGYTLCQGTGEAMSFNPALFTSMPYDPARDFVPVVQLVQIEGVVIGSAAAPFASMSELVSAAKARPGTLNWASFGAASNPHIYLEWIRHQTGADITHVPYRGSAQTTPALLSNEAQVTYTAVGFVLPQIRAGRLKALAATTSNWAWTRDSRAGWACSCPPGHRAS